MVWFASKLNRATHALILELWTLHGPMSKVTAGLPLVR